MTALLNISDLEVVAPHNGGSPQARLLVGVSLSLAEGQAVGITGASGAGKSTLLATLIGMVDPTLVTTGTVSFGQDKLIHDGHSNQETQRSVRGSDIALIRQNPHETLHPMYKMMRQVSEHVRIRQNLSRSEAKSVALDALAEAGFSDPAQIAKKYAHQLSGGEAQRVCLAQALVSNPKVLLADEVFSAVDGATEQDLIEAIKNRLAKGMGLLCVSHDLQLLSGLCDRLAVLHQGSLVEQGPVEDVLAAPAHPHTQALVKAERTLTGCGDG